MMHAPYNKDLQCRNEFVVLGGQYYNETLATAYWKEAFPDGAPTTPYYRFHKVGVENDTISDFYLANFNAGMVNFALNEWTIGIAVNFRYREIYYTVDGIIEDMVKDGRMKSIFAKYGISYAKPEY